MVIFLSLVLISYRDTLNNHHRNRRKNALFWFSRTNLWHGNMGVTGEKR
jgi:hypothetical protein